MQWIEILRKDDYAVLQNKGDTQYVMAWGYNPDAPENQQWAFGTYFTYWTNTEAKARCLANAIDCFRSNIEENYISRGRVEELATKFKDCINGDEDYEHLVNNDMYKNEREFFGIHIDEEVEE